MTLPTLPPLSETQDSALRSLGHVSYLLHAIVAIGTLVPTLEVSVLLLVVAFIIDMVKKPDAQGSWQASHFRWRIHSVLWAFGLYCLTVPLFLLFYIPGKVAWLIISVWFAYRIARGWVSLLERKAVQG
jgi:uncharacterized membrane protein